MVEPIEELRKICQIEEPADLRMPEKKYFRKVSIYFTKMFLYTSISANQTTMLDVFIGLLAGFFYTFKDYRFWIVGFLLYELYRLLDHVDGEIARYRGQASLRGKYLDYISHYFVYPIVLQSMCWGVYKDLKTPYIFIVAFSLCLSDIMIKAGVDTWYRAIASESSSPTASKQPNYLSFKTSSKRRGILRYGAYIFTVHFIAYLTFIAAIFDSLMSRLIFGSFILSYRGLILLIYGIILPFVSLARISIIFYKGKVIGMKSF